MAPWGLMKLLHPFTADDILASRKILSSLNLPASTSQFVLALTESGSPGKVVYVLAVEKLSERSIGDIHSLVTAVNPNSVVAFVDAQYLTEVVEEGELLNSPECLDVPTSLIDVIKTCFVEKIKVSGYESRAGLNFLIKIFGTTFYGNVFAAKKAAEEARAVFEYLRFPSTATASFSDAEGDVEVGDSESRSFEISKVSFANRFLIGFSGLLGGNNVEYLTGVSQRVTTLSRSSSPSEELRALAPSVASTLVGERGNYWSVPSSAISEISEDVEDGCPSFALPFYPLFIDLHQLFKDTPGVNQALNFVRNLLTSVDRGDQVDYEDLSRARLFRVAVESVRVCWNTFVRREWRAPSKLTDFSQLPFEEKCQALLARALQRQAQKFGTVVAIVDASNVPGIRRHWNTPVPPEVAAYAEYCFVALDSEEIGEGCKTLNILESPETKAAVMVSAGAVAAAGLVSLPQWASVPTFMKVFSFKIPTVLKLVWIQMKRQAVVSWASSVTSASKVVMPVLKAAGSGKAALAPSSTAKAMLMKSAASAEKARAGAQSVVAVAERASLQAIRTAFYSLMRSRQARNLGPRPWLVLGGALGAAAGVMSYGEEMEHAIGIVPSAPAVVRLGRGLENLEQASKILNDYESSSWWDQVYDTLYRHPHRP